MQSPGGSLAAAGDTLACSLSALGMYALGKSRCPGNSPGRPHRCAGVDPARAGKLLQQNEPTAGAGSVKSLSKAKKNQGHLESSEGWWRIPGPQEEQNKARAQGMRTADTYTVKFPDYSDHAHLWLQRRERWQNDLQGAW